MKKESNKKKMRFFADVTEKELPFIQIPIDDTKGFTMLIDTGSNNNVMFGYAYEQLKDRMNETDGTCLMYGIDGNPFTVINVEGTFSICGKENNMSFLLRTDDEAGKLLSQDMGFPVAGIIGTKFMAEHGWMLDFAHQEILIPDMDVSEEEFRTTNKLN